MARAKAPRSARLKLAAVLDMKAAAPLHAALLERRGADLILDGGEVEQLGGQCLQVLLAARAAWAADAHRLTIAAPSDGLRAALMLLGAGHFLGDRPEAA